MVDGEVIENTPVFRCSPPAGPPAVLLDRTSHAPAPPEEHPFGAKAGARGEQNVPIEGE